MQVSFVQPEVLEAILTIDNLEKRGKILPNQCCMCNKAEELVNHLLLHCEVVYELWSMS